MKMRKSSTRQSSTSQCSKVSSSSQEANNRRKTAPLTGAERVALFRDRQKKKPGYSNKKAKESERERIAAIRARKEKCPLGRKCKDESCKLHPDRGRVRPERQPTMSRQEKGRTDAHKNRRTTARLVKSLNVKISSLTNEKRRLKRKLAKETELPTLIDDYETGTEDEGSDSDQADTSATSFILSSMSPSKKKTLKRAATTPGFTPIKKKMRNEMNIQLRPERVFAKEDEHNISTLGEKIVKFMMQDDNSFCCPDKDKENIRYRRDTLEVLHDKFMCEEMVDCSYSTFTRNVPVNIKKPKPEDWGTSLCKTCLNPELKLEALKSSPIDSSGITLEWLLALPSTDYPVLRARFANNKLITFKEWIQQKQTFKVPSKQVENATLEKKSYRSVRSVRTTTVAQFMDILLKEVQELKSHNERKISQFRRIKVIRSIVADPANKAVMIRMDWSENATLFQCRQEKSAYYYDIQASVNTTVIYTADGTICAGSISDVKDHTKPAVWASLLSILEAAGINPGDLNHLFVVTDSPSSQYRNKGCIFLAKRYAEAELLDISWIFTESGHGKGPMDGVGAAIKNQIDAAAIASESMPEVSLTCSADVIPHLHLPNVLISTYGADNVSSMKEKLPKKLAISWKKFGISQVHEIFLEQVPSNTIFWKIMSSDPEFSKALFITKTTSRRVIGKQQSKCTTSQQPSDKSGESCSSDEEDDEEEVQESTDFLSEAAVATHLKPLPAIITKPLKYEDVKVNSQWVAIQYLDGKFYLGRVLCKAAGQYKVQCLGKPYGTRVAQELEKLCYAVFYEEVYAAPILPWQTEIDIQGRRTRKTLFKY